MVNDNDDDVCLSAIPVACRCLCPFFSWFL